MRWTRKGRPVFHPSEDEEGRPEKILPAAFNVFGFLSSVMKKPDTIRESYRPSTLRAFALSGIEQG